ncbi:DUF2585 domain-containing protein [Amaricoccus sp.]|uniref:DUF2585 domain-containing protein n=1 Tax=Amaricoccus sp. TaxID=1872485 RepID=UPI001D72043A|nr:DUF2585 domain-containing protein [Amaricoccus sp.]MCB1371402.1 DUF2585 domain-containing protein [Paracoccaceae bacterium]MCC0066171.1 DUF2585 domain-containing protein [Rhodovulum sp.]HRW15361.1 DUF2585 domain-containing protein [Amaricoccus sp.]
MRSSARLPFYLISGLVLAGALVLLAMGRSPICPCGTIRLWNGVVMGPENSQQLSDWYTPSHVIHGFLFYWALAFLLPGMAFRWRLLIATLVEVAWEIVENTDMVIDRYRAVTVSLDYYGDSVLNSTSDVLFMMLGFWLASRLPVWLSVAIAIGFELATTILIRDGLALNVLMLLWPSETIRLWQAGG